MTFPYKTYKNPDAANHDSTAIASHSLGNTSDVLSFHQHLPIYNITPLKALSGAQLSSIFPAGRDHGHQIEALPRVFVKDESHRFSDEERTSSFKILGASVALHGSLCRYLCKPFATEYKDVSQLISDRHESQKIAIQLVSCTDGNWGRALAQCAALYAGGLRITIFVPAAVAQNVVQRIKAVGAHVSVVQITGNYDAAIIAAQEHTDEVNGFVESWRDDFKTPPRRGQKAMLLLDTSFEGYTRVPEWVTLGYETCLVEVDEQLREAEVGSPTMAICSVGVGSWAHAVVSHYKQANERVQRRCRCITVEPTVAPSLLASLHQGEITTTKGTGYTIMEGMNCGTTSDLAWPVLQGGVDVATTVTDKEAHEAVKVLEAGSERNHVLAGPCGAAPLAALRKLISEGNLGRLTRDDVVILFSTEGQRQYNQPD